LLFRQHSGSSFFVVTHSFRYRLQDWQIFRRGKRWSIRLQVGGKRVWIALRTTEIATAERRAKIKIDTLASGRLAEERENRPKGRVPTFGEVAEIYKAAKVVRDATARDNLSTLLMLVRRVTGVTEPKGLTIDVLTGDLATAWLAQKQGLQSVDRGNLRAENVTANSSLRQAASVFAKRHRSIYDGWIIPPGVDDFCGVKMLPEASARYVPLSPKCLSDMDAAAAGLKETDVEMWIVNRSIRLMGLRAGEVAAMKTSWLIERGGRLELDIRARPGEFVPKGHQGAVTVPAILADIFRKRLKEAGEKPAHLIRVERKPKAKGRKPKGDDETARHNLIYRRHSEWLRQFIPADRGKTNHELRKEAGSRVAAKLNSWEAAARFLREDLETAKRHYLELLQPVGLEIEDL